jgi:peptidoglycan/LPS O-acetylase OafA/YrhL
MQTLTRRDSTAIDTFSSSAARKRPDIPALTGLRFVAAFSVLGAHGLGWTLINHETPAGAIYWLKQASAFGMTLFFVLSGFVIHYNYATLITERRLAGVAAFLWARFARLYPLYLLMMVVYILLSSRFVDLWKGHSERFASTLEALPYFLLSVQSWLYKVIDNNPLLSAIGGGSPITWSISTEWFFYLVYPFAVWLIVRGSRPWIAVAMILVWSALSVEVASYLYDQGPQINAWAAEQFGPMAAEPDRQQDSFLRWLLYFSPYLRIGEFVLGALIAQLYLGLQGHEVKNWENKAGFAVFVLAASSVVWITYLNYSTEIGINFFRRLNMNFALAPSTAILIFCAARYHTPASRFLTLRPILALGDASYSIYLVHVVVLFGAERLAGTEVHSLAYDLVKLFVLTILVLIISLTLYTCFEAPARALLRGVGRRTSAPANSAETPRPAAP